MVLTYGGIIMGIIKNRTTLNGELVSLVSLVPELVPATTLEI